MDISTFVWSVIASIVATLILGGAVYNVINKNKTRNTIVQKGKSHQAYMNSTIHIRADKSKKGEGNE